MQQPNDGQPVRYLLDRGSGQFVPQQQNFGDKVWIYILHRHENESELKIFS